MNDINFKQQTFSLDHVFFDGLLDKLAEYAQQTRQLVGNQRVIEDDKSFDSSACVHIIHSGRIYSSFDNQAHFYEAMAIYNGKIWALGSLEEVKHRVYQSGFIATFYCLREEEVVMPGFIEPHCHLITSSILQQWFHFGPFGFGCQKSQFMSQYDLSYIVRSVMYLEKGIPKDDWLLGYGLYSQLLLNDEVKTYRDIFRMLTKVNTHKPLVIFDAAKPFAFVNYAVLEKVHKYLVRQHYTITKLDFYRMVEGQGGLVDEQLLWLLEVLPEHQLKQYCTHLFNFTDQLLSHAKGQGVTHLGVVDSHPVALDLLDTYLQKQTEIHVVNATSKWMNEQSNTCLDLPDIDSYKAVIGNSIALNIGEVGYLGFEWVQSYHGQSTLQPCQTLIKQGMNVCLQSGFPLLPLSPLRSAQQAISREMEYAPHCYMTKERVLGAEQCFTRLQSLKSISISAAVHLKISNQAGCLAEGQHANYVVLSADPLHCKNKDLREIKVVNSAIN
ncbi:amidohydrolase family protein [Pseudoalteromonas sp. MMG012]|uniref:amidohydrolase family protein n=1 Tax=Pseudoalteromonas sp. MMG012 TaxID=2822686 RepID=UPI001B39F58F|nr:amidohydrolase family protein [Pseudoalteromonas sp. MMG012]MBQ4849136.1 amidohydrolase family protein [Pseudoalteromonas sp. MMG012]